MLLAPDILLLQPTFAFARRFFLLLFNSFLEIVVGYFPKDAFNARDLTKCPEVNKIFGIEVEPRFCTPTNVDGQQDDTTGDEYKAK